MKSRNQLICHFSIMLLLLVSDYVSAQQVFTADSKNWKFDNKNIKIETIAGKKAIKIGSGKALLEDVLFEDGTIEFDMYLSGERAFAYLYFRGQSQRDVEAFYVRTHKHNSPDALQYAPVFQKRSAWQLYHGDKGTAGAALLADKWIKVKIELAGEKAKFWIGDMSKPAMVVNQLGHAPKAGWLAFRGFVPKNSPAPYSAYFSGLTVTPSESSGVTAITMSSPEGQLTNWRVSPAFDTKKGPVTEIPAEVSAKKWSKPSMQHDGSFEFLRSRDIPKGFKHWTVAADTVLLSSQASVCEVHLGFSDELTLSVNDQLIVYQDASYRYGFRPQDGLMHPEQLVAFVPLNKGKNILRAVVADKFGGWGLSARMQNCTGVQEK
ncbi:hypothetical protein [uncultured Paraglaciecola sp.]|uniref:hypothetical protein n=1 Tax=uncultured Paraglaciecola sp. TaxID=1765024 RepID=UPI002614D61E|nr:hypothetical protein [uncultured Paraglaciecola sp.]